MSSGVVVNCTKVLSTNAKPLYLTAVARASRCLGDIPFRLYTYLLTAGDSCLRFNPKLVADGIGMDEMDIERGIKYLVEHNYMRPVNIPSEGNDAEYEFYELDNVWSSEQNYRRNSSVLID